MVNEDGKKRLHDLADSCKDPNVIYKGRWMNYIQFAELIIKECCQKLENGGMVEVAMELKEHFGVTE